MGIELDRRYSLVTLGYMVSIFLLSSIPDRGAGDHSVSGRLLSNLLHIPLYAGLTFFFLQAIAGGRTERVLLRGPCWLTLLGTAAYAIFDEWHQSVVPGRYASRGDFLLDLLGILGMLLLLRLRALREARP